MIRAMVREIEIQADYLQGAPITTIYFGGGTPSLLTALELKDLLGMIRHIHQVNDDAEITLEANPDDIDTDELSAWKDLGINRLSIGVQAFQDALLTAWNRSHDLRQGLLSLDMALAAGFENITSDLIYGGEGLTDADWAYNIEQLTSRHIPHISSYALTVEKGTALHHQIERGKVRMPDDEQSNRQFAFLQRVLEAKGYQQYEVSNFSLPGYASRHNTSYWEGATYLGIGPSAHSYNGLSRQWNIAHNIRYLEAMAEGQIPYEREILTIEQQYNEIIMTGLRTASGINMGRIKKLGENYFSRLTDDIVQFNHRPGYEGAIVFTAEGHPYLRKEFLFFADGISSDLFLTEEE